MTPKLFKQRPTALHNSKEPQTEGFKYDFKPKPVLN